MLRTLAVAAFMLPLMAVDSSPAPVVVVFPFVATDRTPTLVGDAVAHSIMIGLQQRPGVAATLAPANAVQNDYLKIARSMNADYYVAGFVSTVGNRVAAIEQLVSTKSGVVVWRDSEQYTVPDDAIPSGVQVHDAIIAFATPQYSSANSAPPPPQSAPRAASPRVAPPPPLPIPNGSSSGDTDAAPVAAAPGPTRAPVATFPARRSADAVLAAVVANFGEGPQGSIPAIRRYTPTAVLRTLPRYHIAGGRADLDESDVATNGLLACAQAGADVILTGWIDSLEDAADPGMGMTYGTHLVLDVYNCRHLAPKPQVYDIHTSNGDTQTSIDIAVNQALKAYAATLKAN